MIDLIQVIYSIFLGDFPVDPIIFYLDLIQIASDAAHPRNDKLESPLSLRGENAVNDEAI